MAPKKGSKQTPAQRAAAERNLRKGNPRAFGGNHSQGDDQNTDGVPAGTEPARGDGKRTYRAKSSKPAEKKPRTRRVPPRPPDPSPAPAPAAKKSSGGFFDGLLKGITG